MLLHCLKKISIKVALLLLAFIGIVSASQASEDIYDLPMRGFAIAAPKPELVERFIEFIEKDVSATPINTIFLRINYNYKFEKFPELADKQALSKKQVKKIVNTARQHNINVIPIINLLGHQSWKQDSISSLLRVYPELEEPAGIKLTQPDFYTRAYCPNHPDIHKYVFSMLDELIEVFDTRAIHVGMDEVFILAEDGCNHCKGKSKAEVFAQEVNTINNHLMAKGVTMYMWGDRLLDGEVTGLGIWAASGNDTATAIDMIDKNVVICDWQYQLSPPSAGYFAMKGFNVISASFQSPTIALQQVNTTINNRTNTTPVLKNRFHGVMHTYWAPFESFDHCYSGTGKCDNESWRGAVATFNILFPKNKK